MGLRLLAILLLLTAAADRVTAADHQPLLELEIHSYIEALDSAAGSDLTHLANKISGSGLSDKRLFDSVQRLLLGKHQLHSNRKTSKKIRKIIIPQELALLRTLASSGNKDYMPTVSEMMGNSKKYSVRKRAEHILNKFDFYHDRNLLMQNMATHQPSQSLHSTRLLNLLNSGNLIMSRYAAEEIARQGQAEPVVQDWLANRLQERIHLVEDKLEVDTLAWYGKVLAGVNAPKYREMLSKFANDKSVDSKIRRHLKTALR